MRVPSVAAAAFITLLSSQVRAENVEGWDVNYFPDSKSPVGCIMTGDFQDGTRLSLIVSKTYEWGLGFANAKWKLQKGSSTLMAAYVDGKFVASGKADHYDTTIVVLPLRGAAAYQSLQLGRGLVVKTPEGNLNFQLKGTAAAMSSVLNCVKSLVQPQPQSGPQPQQARRDFEVVPASEAAVILANLLTAADLRGYHIDTPKDAGVTFTLADGTRGLLMASRGKDTKDADQYASSVISFWSDRCKGDFVSGKQAIPSTDGAVIRKVASSCRMGAETSTTETTIIRRPDGFLIDLSQTAAPSAGLSEAQSSDRTAVVNAALRIQDPRR